MKKTKKWTKKEVIKQLKKTLAKKIIDCGYEPPTFCPVCDSYDSKKHQHIWCSRCPSKIKEYPEMTWADCLTRSNKQGALWGNGFGLHFYSEVLKIEYISDESMRISNMLEPNLKYKLAEEISEW